MEVRNDDGVINLNGDSIDASGVENVTVDGSTVTITAAGEYTVSGTLLDGQIAVALENKSDEVTIKLDGVNVINTTGNAFNATKGKVTLMVNSDSTFTSLSKGDDQTAIFSKNDLTIKGEGTLTAISESGNGIRCKNDLDIGDVDLVVNAGNNGIKGDESVKITKKNRSVTVTAGGDGIKTDELPSYDEETGEYVSGGVITINGGNVTVNATGDGIQSDTLLTINGGFGGGMGTSYGYIEVSGGDLYIEAEGDGFDSNGNALISGGEVYVNGPTSGGNGVFDVGDNNNTLVITGGTVIGAGTSDMAVTPTQANGSQAYVVTTVSTQSAGKAIKLTDASGNAIVNYTPSKNYSWVLISTPNMVSGQSYTLSYGSNQTTLTALTSGGSNGMGGQPGRQPMQQGGMNGQQPGGNMGGQIGGRR